MDQGRRGMPWEVYFVVLLGAGLWIYKKAKAWGWLTHRGGGAPKKAAPSSGSGAHAGGGFGLHVVLPGHLVHSLLHLGLIGVGLLAGWMALSLLTRLWRRRVRARSMQVHEIVLGPDDEAKPQEVKKVLTSIHGTMLTRYAQGALGQDSFAFEMLRDGDGTVHFLASAPKRRIQGIENHLRSKYTNIRFRPFSSGPRHYAWAQQITLTKDWHFATETVRDYGNSVVESIVAAVDRGEGKLHLQYLLTPLPARRYQREIKERVRGIEYEARREQGFDPFAPGVGMATGELEKSAMEFDGKAPYRVEIRLAADDWDMAQQVIGAITEANAENQFQARVVVVGRRLWEKWLHLRLRSLFLFRGSVMFSVALATLIHLPSVRLRVSSLQRSWIRRGNADQSSPRRPELALVRDELGTVGIPEEDRQANILALGSQGTGKSTALMHVIRNDARNKDQAGRPKAMVVVDIGKDTAKRALGLIPPDREVVYVDPADPKCPWSLNPMGRSDVSPAVLSDNMIEALIEIYGEESIRARSREFLGNAFIAIREVMGKEANFTQVYRLLTDHGFRDKIVQGVKDPHQVAYWRGTFTNMVSQNPKFIEEGLAAPRNKLDGILRSEAIRKVLGGRNTGRHEVDFREAIRDRKIVLLNLDKSRIGEDGARTLGVFSIMMLWHAIQAQSALPEEERTKVSLVIDEAQNFLSEGFMQVLSEGRAYGVQTAMAMRFVGEVLSERVQEGIESLVENLIIHRLSSVKEADEKMRKLMRLYANMVQIGAESQDRISFGADDFMRLPNYVSVCRFLAHGRPTQAFAAESIRWEPYFHEKWQEAHLEAQPKAGAPILEEPDVPPPDVKDPLAGLSQRPMMEWWLRTDPQGYACCFIDLDGLKALNDADADHRGGDRYIAAAGRAIRNSIRSGDKAYRVGGDEFVVFVHGHEGAGAFVRRLREGFKISGVSASIGMARQEPGESLVAAMRRADGLMYKDKVARKAGRDMIPEGRAASALGAVSSEVQPGADECEVPAGVTDEGGPRRREEKAGDGNLDKAAGRAALRLSARKEDVLAILSDEGISHREFLAFGAAFFKDHPSSTLVDFRLAWRKWNRREGAGS